MPSYALADPRPTPAAARPDGRVPRVLRPARAPLLPQLRCLLPRLQLRPPRAPATRASGVSVEAERHRGDSELRRPMSTLTDLPDNPFDHNAECRFCDEQAGHAGDCPWLEARLKELVDYQSSFALYYKASMALMDAYKATHPATPDLVWP